ANAADPPTGSAAIWLMNGTAPAAQALIATPPPAWHVIATGDFNGDGKADIIWQYNNAGNAADPANGTAAIWLMNGTAPGAEAIVAAPPPAWHVIATGDSNGDGKSDIIWQYNNSANAADPSNVTAATAL